jgi:hypothetical protein
MTLRQAISLAQQHSEATMTFVVEREERYGGGQWATGSVRPSTAGDGGFIVTRRDGEAHFVAWDRVVTWWLYLEVGGRCKDTVTA